MLSNYYLFLGYIYIFHEVTQTILEFFYDATRFNMTTICIPYDMIDTVNSIGTADYDDSEIIAEQEIWTPL